MQSRLRWLDFATLNAYWLGLNTGSGILTPLLLPYLVAQFVPDTEKSSYLGLARVLGLAAAMLVQPIAGLLSDRSRSRFGRRRPFMLVSALAAAVFLAIIGLAGSFTGHAPIAGLPAAFLVLVVGLVLLQIAANTGQGALQGLIPDLVPEGQRGRASGVKALFELLPILVILVAGPLVDAGHVWRLLGIVAAGYLVTMSVTVLAVREAPAHHERREPVRSPIVRMVALTGVFVVAMQCAVWLVNGAVRLASPGGRSWVIGVAFLVGLAAMSAAVYFGVYVGATIGIGRDAARHRSFIWWIISRLLFLAAAGSIQGFALYFLRDVLLLPNAATMTTALLGAVALFLLPSALGGGFLADRFGRARLVAVAGLVAAAGTLLLLFARAMPLTMVAGSIIGLGTGLFMSTSWALGVDLVPSADAGRFLGISNLAGAGAGIVGAGIGGPIADAINAVQPGLGYLVVFGVYAGLFLLSTIAVAAVRARGPLPHAAYA